MPTHGLGPHAAAVFDRNPHYTVHSKVWSVSVFLNLPNFNDISAPHPLPPLLWAVKGSVRFVRRAKTALSPRACLWAIFDHTIVLTRQI
jgi:hypothetical protein